MKSQFPCLSVCLHRYPLFPISVEVTRGTEITAKAKFLQGSWKQWRDTTHTLGKGEPEHPEHSSLQQTQVQPGFAQLCPGAGKTCRSQHSELGQSSRLFPLPVTRRATVTCAVYNQPVVGCLAIPGSCRALGFITGSKFH